MNCGYREDEGDTKGGRRGKGKGKGRGRGKREREREREREGEGEERRGRGRGKKRKEKRERKSSYTTCSSHADKGITLTHGSIDDILLERTERVEPKVLLEKGMLIFA
jgi:hypothetical protein